MTVIVEDGTGVTSANSPVSVGETDEFFASRNNIDWDSAEDKDASLIKATAYIDARFNALWKGRRTFGRAQGIAFPRTSVLDADYYAVGDTEMPDEYKKAVMIAALADAQGNLDITQDRAVFVTSEQIGQIKMTYERDDPYETGNPGVNFHDYLDQLLVGLLMRGKGSTIFLLRA